MNLATYSEKAFELIPAGVYMVRLDNIEITDKNPKYVTDGGDDKQWKWTFCCLDGEGAGKSLVAWSNRTINRGSTAKPWAEALLGRALVDGETLNSDDVLEQQMKVYIAEHTTEAGQVVNRIKDVLSGPGASQAPTTPNGKADPSVKHLREYMKLKNTLTDKGITVGAIETKVVTLITGMDFKSAPKEEQENVIGVLADWVKNFDSYDADGDIPFA